MLEIRRYRKTDETYVRKICMETAKRKYQNKQVICWMFLDYYLEYEAEHVFVLTYDEEVIGYIVCSVNSSLYENKMTETFLPKISKESKVLGIFTKLCIRVTASLNHQYYGGFHMNITPKYQHLGLGKRLLDVMAYHLKLHGISYMYLVTENKKTKGYGFYKHYGFVSVKKYMGGPLAMVYDLHKLNK